MPTARGTLTPSGQYTRGLPQGANRLFSEPAGQKKPGAHGPLHNGSLKPVNKGEESNTKKRSPSRLLNIQEQEGDVVKECGAKKENISVQNRASCSTTGQVELTQQTVFLNQHPPTHPRHLPVAHPNRPAVQFIASPPRQYMDEGHSFTLVRVVELPPTVSCPGCASTGRKLPTGQYTASLPHSNCWEVLEPA